MSKETPEGITKIAVSGFKSLAEECTIDICPLTILAGANSFREIEHHAAAIDAQADAGGTVRSGTVVD